MELYEILNTEKSKFNFLKGLLYLAKADGEIEIEEQQFFKNIAHNFSLDQVSIKEIETLFNAKEYTIEIEFEEQKQALLLLQEGIQLCHMDGKYELEEQATIYQIADLLSIDSDKVEKIENWVDEGIKWRNEGRKMIEGDA